MSQSLLQVHKSLLHFQKAIIEAQEQRQLSLQEFLQMSMHHPDFAWLSSTLKLVVKIDEAVDHPEADIQKVAVQVGEEATRLFFAPQVTALQQRVSELSAQSTQFCSELRALENSLKTLSQKI